MHDHAGHHAHGPGYDHHHPAPARHDAAFAIGTALNAGLVAVQVGFGLAAGSMALLADAVHDLHVWGLSTTATALTAHLVQEGAAPDLVRLACEGLRERFGVGHCTFQVETSEHAAACVLRPEHVV